MQDSTPHYDAILGHVGSGLTPAVQQDPRCRELGITSGPAYLRLYVASVIRRPEQRLPVIHLYGPPACGKSAFSELFRVLLADGYRHIRGRRRLFNDELEGTIVAVAEDAHGSAVSHLATPPTLTINRMFEEPYEIENQLHVIACSNTPPQTDDPAVVAIEVPPLTSRLPYALLHERLRAEAGNFLLTLHRLNLPEGGLPVPQGVAVA